MAAGEFIVTGLDYRTEKPIAVEVRDGIISNIDQEPNANSHHSLWIAPGLVDLQVNGFQGIDFNTLPISIESIHQITKRLWREGVTTYLPTVITNSSDTIEEILSVLGAAIEESNLASNLDSGLATDLASGTIAGIHLEGPFISSLDGPRGAHASTYVQAPDWNLFERWQTAARGHIRLLTLSPEWLNAVPFIRQCVEHGVKVSIGHTAANSKQIAAAVAAGATFSTHLGNGAHPILPRHPNYIWDQLAADELWAGMIADGYHLPPAVLKVISKVKGAHTILVSDCVDLAGLEPGSYETHVGGRVVLTEEGKLHLADNPNLLAGSVRSLPHGVSTLVREGICSLQEAWDMASTHPATFLGLPASPGLPSSQGSPASHGLAVGNPADIVLFQKVKTEIQVVQTIKSGVVVFDAFHEARKGEAAHE
ncbi:amidohydrolase family protein [Alicyclobacillus curvatus]|jgi:N-acetylglucosamine-6-phosphate deacetylase|nr:amidohydrolase family protein [Alicyclobacillus curvatus]